MRSLLLGLDVSPRRLGWGLVDLVTGAPVACGCEQLWVEKPKSRRELIDWAEHPGRTQDALRTFGRYSEVQAVYVEHPISRYPGVAYNEGVAVGIAIAEVKRRWPWVTVQTLLPSEWRVGAGLKGNATKAEVWREAFRLIVTGSHCPILEQDAADALLIAIAGQKRNDETWTRGAA